MLNRYSWLVGSVLLWTARLQAQDTLTPAKAPSATPAALKPTAAATHPNDAAVEWTIDATHSTIGFTSRHLGFAKVNGHFEKFHGVLKADPKTARLVSIDATAETASIDTGIEKRDAHLRSDDFLNAEKFPQLKLATRAIKWNGSKFTAQVDLTIRDVTKSIPFKGELLGVHEVDFGHGKQLRAGYEASATINRKDFGLKWNAVTEGVAVVADAIDISLAAEIGYTPPPAAASAAPTLKPAASNAAVSSVAQAPTPTAPALKPAAPSAPSK
ncbi:MAG: YceI family protein [Polyangiales bacterium]